MKLNNKRTILVGLAFLSICAFWQMYDNIIPLIPQHDLKNCEAPSCVDLAVARKEAGKYIDVFRHCQHCRADAVGVPGKNNFSQEVYKGLLQAKETFSHG